jgi:hypothetical protein
LENFVGIRANAWMPELRVVPENDVGFGYPALLEQTYDLSRFPFSK